MSNRLLLLVAVLVVVVALFGTARSAQARVSWCLLDLGPMATRAEDTGKIPDNIKDKKIEVPTKAVSTEKGGDNEHK